MIKTAILFFIFIVVIVILADTGNVPHSLSAIYRFRYGDKWGHFILFGLLSFFIIRAAFFMFSSRPLIKVALSVGLTLALFVALEEWSQKFFPSRTFEMLDLLASLLGVAVGGFIAMFLSPRPSPQ